MMHQIFSKDFDTVLEMLFSGNPFALSRFADGEASILKNRKVGNKDGWLYRPDKNLVFRRDLRLSLLSTDQNFFYGLSCTCCDQENHQYLLANTKTNLNNLTFSNIWVNANYSKFNEKFISTLKESGRPVILCSGSKARISDINELLPISDFIPIPGNCITYWERNRDFLMGLMDLKATQYQGAIFLFAIGPLSEILIHQMWQANPKNSYIDIGSTLDKVLFRRNSRLYHTLGNPFSDRVCSW